MSQGPAFGQKSNMQEMEVSPSEWGSHPLPGALAEEDQKGEDLQASGDHAHG